MLGRKKSGLVCSYQIPGNHFDFNYAVNILDCQLHFATFGPSFDGSQLL